MSNSQTSGPHGTVAVLFSSDAARYSAFAADLAALEVPEGTVTECVYHGEPWKLRNELVERAIKRGSYWIWFITEDYSFPPNVVTTLLSRDSSIVVPVVLGNQAPFHPQAYTTRSRTGARVPLMLGSVTGPGSVLEIESAVTAGMLVRRAVLEALDPPWFGPDADSELEFCDAARAKGFDAFIDTSVRLGNRCTASMEPTYVGGKWQLSVAVGTEAEFVVPLQHG